ncbi:hypothetical protein J6590_048575 [Homalodisca vitripennis]|nr:hypothetical protein J6590_048575 [Homalodisca vitripennis]
MLLRNASDSGVLGGRATERCVMFNFNPKAPLPFVTFRTVELSLDHRSRAASPVSILWRLRLRLRRLMLITLILLLLSHLITPPIYIRRADTWESADVHLPAIFMLLTEKETSLSIQTRPLLDSYVPEADCSGSSHDGPSAGSQPRYTTLLLGAARKRRKWEIKYENTVVKLPHRQLGWILGHAAASIVFTRCVGF